MQRPQNINCIKIAKTGKGLHHWEDQLLLNQLNRLIKLLAQYNVDPWKKRTIINIFKSEVTRENIISLHSHPIQEFLLHLLDGTLSDLETYSSIKSNPS